MSTRTGLLRWGGIGAAARGANFKSSKTNIGNEIRVFRAGKMVKILNQVKLNSINKF